MSGGCVNPIGIASDLSSLLYIFKSSFSMLYALRSYSYIVPKGIYTDTTKTKKSQRSSKFPPMIMELLKAYKKEQDAERERLGDKWQDTDRIFVKWDGRPMNNNTPYFWFGEFCKKHNFRFCDIHSLRHLHASLLINAGVDMVSVSSDMGHSCVGTTINIPYGHTPQSSHNSIKSKTVLLLFIVIRNSFSFLNCP